MREEEFKMERKELLDTVKPGEWFDVTEQKLPNSYYYTLGRAYAMSANFSPTERIKSNKGKVIKINHTPKGFFVTVGFEE